MKCIVKDCTNHSHQGKFIGELCSPCYSFITTGEGVYSQAYRNTVLAEREACAKVCEEYDMDHVVGQQLADTIRAMGEK